MGLFSFLKKAGAKLFDKADKVTPPPSPEGNEVDAAERLKQQKIFLLRQEINNHHIPIRELSLDLEDDIVHVAGEVDTQAEREKAILVLGNVEGVGCVDDKIRVLQTEPEADFYEVKRGDSLSKIAKQYYGNAMKYPEIFEANKPMLKDPNLIYPGQVLRIPKL